MSDPRAEILDRVAQALRAAPAVPHAERAYRRFGTRTPADRIALFCERVAEYRADVRRVGEEGTAAAIAAVCRERGARRLAVPPGSPAAWRPAELELVEDNGLSPHELDQLDGVLTGCTVAIAETGTVALTSGAYEGRRALTLVPDLHICVVDESQIVELVPEAIARLGELVRAEHRPVTLISGPSATSDIELSRVEGVHGPRTLVVLVTTSTTGPRPD